MFRLVVLFAGVFAVQGQTTNVQRCTASAAQNADIPLNTYIHGCVNPPCSLPQGEYINVDMVFRAPRTMTRMTTRAQAFVFIPLPINHDLEEHAETCNFLTNSFCPVIAGEVLRYRLQMLIEPIWPVGIPPTVEFRIEDDANVPIVCVRVPIVVAAPLNRTPLLN